MFIFVLFYAMSSLVFIHLLVDIIEVRTSMHPRCSCGLGSFVSWNHKLKNLCGCQCVHQQLWNIQASFISCWSLVLCGCQNWGSNFALQWVMCVCERCCCMFVSVLVWRRFQAPLCVHCRKGFMEIVFSASLVQGLVVRARYR